MAVKFRDKDIRDLKKMAKFISVNEHEGAITGMLAMVAKSGREAGHAEGRAEAELEIVAWLRKFTYEPVGLVLADAIERGEHRPKK